MRHSYCEGDNRCAFNVCIGVDADNLAVTLCL
jgi:hypothetical protein